MKKCLIGALYVISALLCGVLVIAFVEKVYFHVAPVIVIVVLALQAVIFFARDTATSSNVSSGNLNSTEVGLLLRTIAYVTVCNSINFSAGFLCRCCNGVNYFLCGMAFDIFCGIFRV